MKTYYEKLNTEKWYSYRREVFRLKGMECETCGESKSSGPHNQVHHIRYIRGREPWEYSMDQVTVLCKECHNDIHQAESDWRDLIRSSPSHIAFDFQCLVDELFSLEPSQLRDVLAKSKVYARKYKYGMVNYNQDIH